MDTLLQNPVLVNAFAKFQFSKDALNVHTESAPSRSASCMHDNLSPSHGNHSHLSNPSTISPHLIQLPSSSSLSGEQSSASRSTQDIVRSNRLPVDWKKIIEQGISIPTNDTGCVKFMLEFVHVPPANVAGAYRTVPMNAPAFVTNATQFLVLIGVMQDIGFMPNIGPLPLDKDVHTIIHKLHPLHELQGTPGQGWIQFRLVYAYFNWRWNTYSRMCDVENWAHRVVQTPWPNSPKSGK